MTDPVSLIAVVVLVVLVIILLLLLACYYVRKQRGDDGYGATVGDAAAYGGAYDPEKSYSDRDKSAVASFSSTPPADPPQRAPLKRPAVSYGTNDAAIANLESALDPEAAGKKDDLQPLRKAPAAPDESDFAAVNGGLRNGGLKSSSEDEKDRKENLALPSLEEEDERSRPTTPAIALVRTPSSDDEAAEVGRILAARSPLAQSEGDLPRKVRTLSRGSGRERSMSLATPSAYGIVRERGGGSGTGTPRQNRSAFDIRPLRTPSIRLSSQPGSKRGSDEGVDRKTSRTPRPAIVPDEPMTFVEYEVQLSLQHLEALNEIVVTVKQGRKFSPEQEYAVLVTADNAATGQSESHETVHTTGTAEPRWFQPLLFRDVQLADLDEITITVAIIRKDHNDMWELEGHIVLSEISPHVTGRNHFMKMMAKEGTVTSWHRVATYIL